MLGAVILEGRDAVPKVLHALKPSDFYTESHRAIYTAMLALYEREQPVDSLTLQEELRRTDQLEFAGGPAAIALLMEEASILVNLPSYVAMVRDMGMLRDLIQTSTQIIGKAFDAKEDVAAVVDEWLERAQKTQQRVIATAQPLPAYTWQEILSQEAEKVVYAWPGWLIERKVYLIAGAGDSMKSFLCTFLATMTAAGRPALEEDSAPCRQGAALIVSAENGLEEDRRRFHLLRRGYELPEDLPITLLDAGALSLTEPATWASFIALVEKTQPRLVVIDSGISVADLENENDNAGVSKFMKKCILPLARVYGATVLLIVHSPKPPKEKGLTLTDEHVARGASAWRNSADGLLYLRRDRSLGPHAVVLRTAKVRAGYRHPAIWFEIKDTEVDDSSSPPVATAVQIRYGGAFAEETGQAEAAAAALIKAIEAAVQVLKESPGSKVQTLVDALTGLKISEATARRAIAVLRGFQPWPAGPHKGNKHAVVDETKGKRNAKFLTFITGQESAVMPTNGDDDDVPF